MNELREDPVISRRWIVLSPKRANRPSSHAPRWGKCFFCPGKESLTPQEIFKIADNGKWLVRVIPNKFPAFSTDYPKAYGLHWVIIETQNHHERFFRLSRSHMTRVIEAYIEAMKKAWATKGITSVLLFKNEGEKAGMSSKHMHSQLIATKKMFPYLEEELKVCKQYWEKNKRCVYCDEIKRERKSERFIYENSDFTAFAPYASVYPYTVMIFPKKHMADFTKLDIFEVDNLVDILKKTLTAISHLGYGYNFYIHTSKKPYHHFHLEIRPRPNIFAGFELGSGIIINVMPPETAAKYLREKISKMH
jgi:UDPglucose--hexose-1-phosphate uridylyltransferase